MRLPRRITTFAGFLCFGLLVWFSDAVAARCGHRVCTCCPELSPLPKEEPPDSALIRLRVPEEAEVWINKVKTSNKGVYRFYRTGKLRDGETYRYKIYALIPNSNTTNAKKTGVKKVKLQPGGYTEVAFDRSEFK